MTVTILPTIMVNFALPSNVIGLIKIQRVRWAGSIARTHKKNLVGNVNIKKLLNRLRNKWECNIKE